MKKMKLALVLGACLIGGVAVAAPKWDANGDGTISAQEKAQKHEAMKAKRQEMKAQMLQKFDANKDGTLDKNERAIIFDSFAAERFSKLDTNGDGQLSLAEFKAGKQLEGRHHGFGGRRGHMKAR